MIETLSPVRLVLAALTVFRLARLVAYDEGPFAVFKRLRLALGAYDLGPDGEPVTAFGRAIICPFCLGIWFALPMAMLVLIPTLPGDVFMVVLGLAGAQDALQAHVGAA